MRRTGLVLLVVAVCLGSRPAKAQGYELGMLMLLAGPVSEAVQETVLLIRRGGKFVSVDSLVVACTAGASAGAMVGLAPAVGFTATGVAAPVAVSYVAGAALLSCGMAIASGAGGMGTARLLELWRRPEPATVPHPMVLAPATKG